jgi:dTDP-4-amino-4,6-dideoxygalactose transaminase
MMTNQSIPFLDLVTAHRELEEELVEAFRRAVRSAHFIGGPEVEKFEQEFAEYCGTQYCVGLASGTDAVRFALIAAGVRPGDAVITVAHTFIATVEGISQAGAATEFVDIDEWTYNLSPESLASYLAKCSKDPKTGRPLGLRTHAPISAVLPVHLYGQVADITAITRIAEQYGLIVIEDACQAHGAEYRGRGRAGSLAKAGAFSFYPGKNLGACGEAGAITTDVEAVANHVRRLRDHGQSQKYYHQIEGYNGRLDALQAAFLRIKLRRLDQWNALRRVAARRYSELLAPLAMASAITLPAEPEWSQGVFHLYVVRTADRDGLAKALLASGIQTGLHYPVPLHQQECYRHWGYATGSLPVTERIASEIISLPMFPGLTLEQQQRISDELVRTLAPAAVGSAN